MLRTLTIMASLFILSLPAHSASIDDLVPQVKDVNLTARADLPGFKANLSTTFGVPVPRIDGLIATLGSPADAYFCLKIGQLSGRPIDVVTREFQKHGHQGWGVVAKNLGIKPGSRAFHQLKETGKIKQKGKKDKGPKNSSKNKKKKK